MFLVFFCPTQHWHLESWRLYREIALNCSIFFFRWNLSSSVTRVYFYRLNRFAQVSQELIVGTKSRISETLLFSLFVDSRLYPSAICTLVQGVDCFVVETIRLILSQNNVNFSMLLSHNFNEYHSITKNLTSSYSSTEHSIFLFWYCCHSLLPWT